MSWKDELNEAMARYLRDSGKDAVEVTGFSQRVDRGWGCETCGPEYDVYVEIDYMDSEGKVRYHEYYGDFSDLIRALTD